VGSLCGSQQRSRGGYQTKELKPDVAILDIGMPILNALEATRQISRNNPNTRVLILTITDADDVVRTVLDVGARGFLLKSDAAHDLIGRSKRCGMAGPFSLPVLGK
jgi:DNA-binding NarL/FixJ family response regulator